MNPTNYQALGEHTAYTAQAKDAARRLRNSLQAIAQHAQCMTNDPATCSLPILRNSLDIAELAQRELREAMRRANQAADLCGLPRVATGNLSELPDMAVGTPL